MKTTLLLVALTVATAQGKEDQRTVAEEELREKLFAHYNKKIMPGVSLNVTVKKLSFRYIQMNEEKHRLDVHSWVYLEWVDQRLAWKPGNYHSISMLYIPLDAVWAPDLTIYNGGDPDHQLIPSTTQYRVVLYSSAKLVYVPSVVLRFTCLLDLTYWPHDEHHCTLKFGSWVYDSHRLDLHVDREPEVKLGQKKGWSEYELSETEWSVERTSATRQLKYHPCYSDPFVVVMVSLHLRRNAPAYTWLVKTPVVCLTLVSVVVFLLPTTTQTGVKVTFGGLLMVFDLLFLTFASNTVAHSPSHTPLLVKLVVVELVLMAVSVVVSGLVGWLVHSPHSDPLPPPLRRPTVILAHLLFLQTYARKPASPSTTKPASPSTTKPASPSTTKPVSPSTPKPPSPSTTPPHQTPGLGITLKPDEVALNNDTAEVGGKSRRGESASQWRLLTLVVDRLALALYLVLTFFILVSFSCVL